MPDQTVLPPQSALIEAHPTLRRLSGQVIWCMFEEADAALEDIQSFLDRYEAIKAHTTALVAKALDPAHAPLVRLTVSGPGPSCASCQRLHGTVLRLDGPEAVRFLPPFALGCRIEAESVAQQDEAALAHLPRVDRQQSAPPCDLVCGEWIFSQVWHQDKS